MEIILDGCVGGTSVPIRLHFNLNQDTNSPDKYSCKFRNSSLW